MTIELAEQVQQGFLLFHGEDGELLTDVGFMIAQAGITQVPTAIGEVDAIRASLLLAVEEMIRLHRVEQLGHVAFGDQEGIGEFLLCSPFLGPRVVEDIKTADGEVPRLHRFSRAAIDLLIDTQQTKPDDNRQRDSVPLGWRGALFELGGRRRVVLQDVHTYSLDLNYGKSKRHPPVSSIEEVHRQIRDTGSHHLTTARCRWKVKVRAPIPAR